MQTSSCSLGKVNLIILLLWQLLTLPSNAAYYAGEDASLMAHASGTEAPARWSSASTTAGAASEGSSAIGSAFTGAANPPAQVQNVDGGRVRPLSMRRPLPVELPLGSSFVERQTQPLMREASTERDHWGYATQQEAMRYPANTGAQQDYVGGASRASARVEAAGHGFGGLRLRDPPVSPPVMGFKRPRMIPQGADKRLNLRYTQSTMRGTVESILMDAAAGREEDHISPDALEIW